MLVILRILTLFVRSAPFDVLFVLAGYTLRPFFRWLVERVHKTVVNLCGWTLLIDPQSVATAE